MVSRHKKSKCLLLMAYVLLKTTMLCCLEKQIIFPKDRRSRQSICIFFTYLFVCVSFTKLHLLARLRSGPSPASCSVSGIHLPACRHASTPGIRQRDRERQGGTGRETQREMNKATANYVDLKECDTVIANRGWQSLCLFYHNNLEDFKYWQSCDCWQRKMPTAWWS